MKFAKVLFLLALPFAILIVGGAWMNFTSQRYVVPGTLNTRLQGYGLEEVNFVRYEVNKFKNGFAEEGHFLRLDFLFPCVYGIAIAASLATLWNKLGQPFRIVWLFMPLAFAIVGDWTENYFQLTYLFASVAQDPPAHAVRIASFATQVKLVGLLVSLAMVPLLAGGVLFGMSRRVDSD